MASHVWLKKGASRRMKKTVTSPQQARRLSTAIKAIQTTPVEKLEQYGVVKKLDVSGRDDVYVYHAGMKDRVVFSPFKGDYVVHDIVTIDGAKSAKSLLSGPRSGHKSGYTEVKLDKK